MNRNVLHIYGEHYKTLLAVGMPLVMGQIGMLLVSFADTLMIGHHGLEELAAASFVNNVFILCILIGLGFASGLTPMVGALYGQGRLREAGRVLRNSLAANALMGMGLTGVMGVLYFFLPRLGQPEELLPLIRPYYLVQLVSLLPVMLFNSFKQYSDGASDTKPSMWIVLSGNLLNIVGNYLLIYGRAGLPEMGLMGAGISTLLSRLYMAVAFAWLFFGTRRYGPGRRGFYAGRIDRAIFRRLHVLGVPLAFQMGMETASFSLCAVMVGWLGTLELAAHQIMVTISQVCFMVYCGMAAAVSVRVSFYHGRGDKVSVRRTAYAGHHLILLCAFITTVPLLLLRNDLGGLFTESAEVSRLIAMLVLVLALYQFGDGMQINYANALRGIADVKSLMLYAFIAYFVVSLPASYFFGFVMGWGLVGVWLAFPFGLTIAALLYFFRFEKQTRPAEGMRTTDPGQETVNSEK